MIISIENTRDLDFAKEILEKYNIKYQLETPLSAFEKDEAVFRTKELYDVYDENDKKIDLPEEIIDEIADTLGECRDNYLNYDELDNIFSRVLENHDLVLALR